VTESDHGGRRLRELGAIVALLTYPWIEPVTVVSGNPGGHHDPTGTGHPACRSVSDGTTAQPALGPRAPARPPSTPWPDRTSRPHRHVRAPATRSDPVGRSWLPSNQFGPAGSRTVGSMDERPDPAYLSVTRRCTSWTPDRLALAARRTCAGCSRLPPGSRAVTGRPQAKRGQRGSAESRSVPKTNRIYMASQRHWPGRRNQQGSREMCPGHQILRRPALGHAHSGVPRFRRPTPSTAHHGSRGVE
jgi:hypothetical protein